MKSTIFALLVLWILMGVSFATDCLPSVQNIYVKITVRDYGTGEGYKELPSQQLDLKTKYSKIYNHTYIYIDGYNVSNLCSGSCRIVDSGKFTIELHIINEIGGSFGSANSGIIQENDVSKKFVSEGRHFSIQATEFEAIASCDEFNPEDYEGAYCSDYTEYKYCSETQYPYSCQRNFNANANILAYEYDLTYDTACLKNAFDITYYACVSGAEKNVICGNYNQAIVKPMCIDGNWIYRTIETCQEGVMCSTRSGNPSCDVAVTTVPDKCSDGTPKGACTNSPPLYCNDVGILINSPKICGCPQTARYEPTTNTCLYLRCSDETAVGDCSFQLPYYCSENGVLIQKASICGCPEGYLAANDTCTLIPHPATNQTTPPQENQTNITTEQPAVNETPQTPPSEVPPSQPPVTNSSQAPSQNETGTSSSGEGIPRDLLYGAVIGALIGVVAYLYFKKPPKHKKH
jgi:hypothetical protein